jgi:hypothetical protein
MRVDGGVGAGTDASDRTPNPPCSVLGYMTPKMGGIRIGALYHIGQGVSLDRYGRHRMCRKARRRAGGSLQGRKRPDAESPLL